MKAGIISLGCAKNLVDTENMLGLLQKGGIELTKEPGEADILIVNTCAFIETAKKESITTVLNMAEYKTAGKCRSLIVAGCLGQRYGQTLLDEMPEADGIVGTGAWNRIMEAVEETLRGRRVLLVGESEIIYDAKTPRILATPGYTAYLKIAEGCDNRCSFCAIPMIRGRYRSRKVEDVVAEAKALAVQGVKELNLIAQDTTAYGRDIYGKAELPRLLKELAKIEEVRWIRCLYSYPRFFTDELIDVIASEPKLVKYVDLPLQHADDGLLRQMHRADTRASMEALLAKLRDRIPGVAIRSTFIVGFPGETEAQFASLRSFIEEQRFDKAGIFICLRIIQQLVHYKSTWDKKYTVIFLAATQEETGLRGAKVAASAINPDISIDFDVTFACNNGRGVKREKYGNIKLGEGGVIQFGPDKSERLNSILIDAAEHNDIKYQRGVSRAGGTNTSAIQLAAADCETTLISIPNKDMHTPVELVSKDDIESIISLVSLVIEKNLL